MSVITGNPPPDDGGEGGGLRATGTNKPTVRSITIEYPDDWTIEQVEAAQKRIYKALAHACRGGGGE